MTAPSAAAPVPGVSVEVLAAALGCAVSTVCVAAAAQGAQSPPAVTLLVGWPTLCLGGGIVLDRRPGLRAGRAMVAAGLLPALVVLWSLLRFGDLRASADVWRAAGDLAGAAALALALLIPASLRPPRRRRVTAGSLLLGVVGAVLVLLPGGGAAADVGGSALLLLACAGAAAASMRAARQDDRADRRRLTWSYVAVGAGVLTVGVGWPLLTDVAAGYLVLGTVLLVAMTLTRLLLATELRPIDEPLLDVALVTAGLGAASALALLVRLVAQRWSLPSPDTSAAYVFVVTLAMAVPAATWLRRAALGRRYGSGSISPADVADITADLHAQTEPRELLDKAARMVATASGSAAASITLGSDDPVVPECWVLRPLLIGGDRVGSLVLAADDPEGPELRQARVVDQLLPTVALVARAVSLAVEAEHARRDVSRERETERARIMADLHDGLGPILAGMSMRVQAVLRQGGGGDAALLHDLADGLAASRTDLRRIVAGLTPSGLSHGDLASSLTRLVASFRGPSGPVVSLETDEVTGLSQEAEVTLYRCVAEGITNALRHSRATRITVTVAQTSRNVRLVVVDDGCAGPIVAGVGLSSLYQRASAAGGHLAVETLEPTGTRLALELPKESP